MTNHGLDFWAYDIVLPALVGVAAGLVILLVSGAVAFWVLSRQLSRKQPVERLEEWLAVQPKPWMGSGFWGQPESHDDEGHPR